MLLQLSDHWVDELTMIAADAVAHARPHRVAFGHALETALHDALADRPAVVEGLFQPYTVAGGWAIGQMGWDAQLGRPVLRLFRLRRAQRLLGPVAYPDRDQCQRDCDRLNRGPWAEPQT